MADSVKNGSQSGKVKGRLNIKVNDDVAKGTYANLGIVHNNDTEFIFDFIFMEPQRRQGHVVSRIVSNPRTVKRLLSGLTELVRLYEERFGVIEVPESGSPQSTYH
ncbi:MAG: DUF3467 domain-containing protein [Proteobacteria bacterium]|nr:DUF3467 domain-containing protein [Pseudomonadota bacterium]